MANYLNVRDIRGLMEMTGRGRALIQKECQENGLPLPQWTADENSVALTFFAKKNAEDEYKTVGGNEVGKEKSDEKSKEKILTGCGKRCGKKCGKDSRLAEAVSRHYEGTSGQIGSGRSARYPERI